MSIFSEEIVVRAPRRARSDIRRFRGPAVGGMGSGREFGVGRGAARRPTVPVPAPASPIDEITVTARRIVPRVIRLGGPLTFAADIAARMADVMSQRRLDEAGYLATRPVIARPDTPVQTIPPDVIPEIVVTAPRPSLGRPAPVIVPRRRAIPRRRIVPERRPFRPPRRPAQPVPPVIPQPALPRPTRRRRLTPVPPLRWPMNPNLPVPATPNLPGRPAFPIQPRPTRTPDNVPTRPVPTITPGPTPIAPSPIFTPVGPAGQPAPPTPVIAPAPGPQPAPGNIPTPATFPLSDPAVLTTLQEQVLRLGETSVAQFAVPRTQLAAASICPPCPPSKKDKDKRRTECYKKMVYERAYPRWDDEYKWEEIDCLTGRPI